MLLLVTAIMREPPQHFDELVDDGNQSKERPPREVFECVPMNPVERCDPLKVWPLRKSGRDSQRREEVTCAGEVCTTVRVQRSVGSPLGHFRLKRRVEIRRETTGDRTCEFDVKGK